MDPPDNIVADTVCQHGSQRVELKWNRPYTLLGVDIISYTVELGGREYSDSCSTTIVDDPYISSLSCENQIVCVSATTLAGMSDFSCIEAILTGGKQK